MSRSGGGDIVTELKLWFESCPLFTKGCLIYICSTLSILNIFTPISAYLINYPFRVINFFEIYRLIFSPLVNQNIVSLLFGFFVYLGVSARLERKWGTVKTIADFFWKNFLINVTLVIVDILLSFVLDNVSLSSSGLWPIYFSFLVEQSLENPEAITMLFCLPFQIKAKYLPIALWLLFSLFSGPRIELLVAMLVGYVHFKSLNNRYHSYLNDRRMISWEGSFLFNWLKSFSSFAYSSIGLTGAYAPSQAQPQASGFRAFGGKGVTLGGPAEPSYQPRPPTYNPNQQAGYFVQNDEHDPTDIYAQEPAYQQRPQSYMPNQQAVAQNQNPNYGQNPTEFYVPPAPFQNNNQDDVENNNNRPPQNR